MRSSPMVRILAYSVAALTLVLGSVSAIVTLVFGGVPEVAIFAWVVLAPVFGLVLLLRNVANRMGVLLLAMGFAGSIASLGAAIPFGPRYLSWLPLVLLSGLGWIWFFGLTLAGLPLLFPTGRPPSRRWKPLVYGFSVFLLLGSVMALFGEEQPGFCSDGDAYYATCAEWEGSGLSVALSGCEPVNGVRECQVLLENPIGSSFVPTLEGSVLGELTYGGLLLTALLSVVALAARMRARF